VRVYSATELAYLQSGKPFGSWMYVRFVVRDGDGDPVIFDFSDMAEGETVVVIDPADLGDDARDYLGGGHLIDVEDITYVAGNEIVTIEVRLSMLSEEVRDMVEAHQWSRARVEIHEGLIHADTMRLVDKPGCVWFGTIDRIAPIKAAQADDEGSDGDEGAEELAPAHYLVTVANHLREMDRGNTELRSPQTVRERDGDEIGDDFREVGKWVLPWGEETKNEEGRGGGRRRDGTVSTGGRGHG
jgi:hypothetical protein